MDPAFFITALITLAGAVAAMSLRRLVHCALCLTVTFAGLAAFYLQLNAQFIGFAQILVYIGAVAILVVFAILLTRSGGSADPGQRTPGSICGLVVALTVFATLVACVLSSVIATRAKPPLPETSVNAIGLDLMTNKVLPLEVLALLLTAAMIGAVVLAMPDKEGKK